MFKTDQNTCLQLELIKNAYHRQSVAKLRSGNHNLRIEIGRHSAPNRKIYEFAKIVHLMR